MSDQRPIMIDLFAGAGGLTAGLEAAGFRSLYANEVVGQYAATHSENHPEVIVDNSDIRTVDANRVMGELGISPGQLDLLAGGPPCQGFSINAPVRSNDDRRNHLFLDFVRFAQVFEPKSIVIENVPGLVSFEKGETLSQIFKALNDLGYGVDVRVLYAPHFGVPQMRWRTVVIGMKAQGVPSTAFPQPVFSAPRRVNFTSTWQGKPLTQPEPENAKPHTTLAQAIEDLPRLEAGQQYPAGGCYSSQPTSSYQQRLRRGSSGVFNHAAPRLSAVNLERLAHIPPGGNWTNIPFELLPAGMKKARQSDHTKRYGRSLPDALSSTILTKCDPHWGAYFHYNQDRSFTVREAARIQSFPDRYVFKGSVVDQYAQVGNAVPPLLAQAIGASLLKTMAA